MSRIDRKEVERIARLARLRLSDSEVEAMTSQLAAVLDYAEQLSAVDTTGIEPTAHVTPVATPLREDRAAPPLSPERAVANAPAHAESAFLVPPVLEGEEEG